MNKYNIKCLGCGFIQEYHSTKRRCPKCGRQYRNRVNNFDFESF